MVTRRIFKQLGPVDINYEEYTVNYEEDGITLDNTLNLPPIAIISSDNFDDFKYLLHKIIKSSSTSTSSSRFHYWTL